MVQTEVKRAAKIVTRELWGEATNTSLLMFFGHPRSGHSLVGSIIDAHPRAIVANEYNLLKRIQRSSPESIIDRGSTLQSKVSIIEGILGNSRGCADRRVQAGYNYSIGGGWQGRWQLPLKVVGDKKGGDTARQFAINFPESLEALAHFRSLGQKAPPFKYKMLRVIRNPWDQIASAFARAYFHTHPDLFAQSRFDTAAFRNIAANIIFSSNTYNGADNELQHYGSLARNIVGRTLEFFSLHDANERFRSMLNASGSGQLPETEWLDVFLDDLQAMPQRELHRMCEYLDLEPTPSFMSLAVSAVSTSPSEPSRTFRWPSNVVAAIRNCLYHDKTLRRFAHHEVQIGEPILPDLSGWDRKDGCIFAPHIAATMFKAHCMSHAQPISAACRW